MHRASKIFLIGFMGSGKTTAGRRLASFLKWSFIDLDEKIEKLEGMNIPDIFSLKGEASFRKLEEKVLKELASETNVVISTGGGTPCFGDNMDFMLNHGLTIYLRLDPASLEKRLAGSTEGRPLLRDLKGKDLQEYISSMLAEREKSYLRAELTVDFNDTDLQELYSLVRTHVRQ